MNRGTALLPAIRALARQAGEVVMAIYHSAFTVAIKPDESPVTLADQAAERLIVEGLRRLAPDIPVVAEEDMAAGNQPDIAAGVFWLVDPLDGTKAFIRRNGEFTINIALIENGQPTLGVVYAPALERLYAAAGPGTAMVEQSGTKRPLCVRPPPAGGMVVVASHMHGNPALLEAFLQTRQVQAVIHASSALKLCLVAAGEADLYPRFGRTMEWDTAAGHAILEAAGGCVCTTNSEALRYGKPGFDNPHFIACGALSC